MTAGPRVRKIAAAVALATTFAIPAEPHAQGDKPHPFEAIAAVLQHPRCLNCHPRNNMPANGEDGRPHRMKITSGRDGFGAPAARCGACHRSENNEFTSVPGAEGWRLAPRSMGWIGLSRPEVCRVLKDPKLNGGLDLAGLLKHMDTDPRVLWGWDPGKGRKAVPIAHTEFMRLMKDWVDAGGPCPTL